ncbi:tyrosine-type recombinase/integrase [Nocardia veterana]|uniref:Site-specific integrase n=1 Tax=Nocardia veterana TaxID=132249 RepID=A0A7X6RK86_9NOCA|nr:site-specific integrase [Nocardia veterana]NKY89047.1 site-specific integrase [Nocardia veterana]
MARTRQPKRLAFGRTRQERSGRWSAAYLHNGTMHRAPATFETKNHAVAWLTNERHLIDLDRLTPGTWTAPADRSAKATRTATTVGQYAEAWHRDKPMSRRTRDSYRYLIDSRLTGTALADMPVTAATVTDVREWFGQLDASKPTARARAYEMLSSMFSAAVAEGLLPVTPCKVPGATKVRRARSVVHIESPEVETLAGKMPEHLRAAVLIAAWCGLRFGEVVALDRADVAADGSTVSVSKGMTRRGGVTEIAAPKSETSNRLVAVPPHIRAALVEHLRDHTGPGDNAPLFTDADGERVTEGKFRPHWHRARAAAGRPTLRFHDLRHHAGMVAAYAGATITESMARLGHSSPKMALHYAERAANRDALLADRIAAMASGAPGA